MTLRLSAEAISKASRQLRWRAAIMMAIVGAGAIVLVIMTQPQFSSRQLGLVVLACVIVLGASATSAIRRSKSDYRSRSDDADVSGIISSCRRDESLKIG